MKRITPLLLAGAIATLPLPALAQLPELPGLPAESLGALSNGQGFSTSVEMTSSGGMPASRMTIYYAPKPERVRMELRMPSLERSIVTIAHLDEGVTYQEVAPNSWMKTPLPQGALGKMSKGVMQANAGVKRESLPQATVDGRLCDVTRITQTGGGQSLVYSSKGIPVKVVQQSASGNVTLRFVNFQQGTPSSGLFAPPANAEVLDMQQMMKDELGDLLAE